MSVLLAIVVVEASIFAGEASNSTKTISSKNSKKSQLQRRLVKHNYFLATLCFFATFLIAESILESSFALEYKNYTSNKYMIQFQYPADWTFEEEDTVTEFGKDIPLTPDNRNLGVGVFSGVLSSKSIETESLEEMILKESEVFEEVMSWKIIEEPNVNKYRIAGGQSASVVYERESNEGEQKLDLNIYTDHNGKRYFFVLTSDKNSFYDEESSEIRNNILDSIVFLD